MTVERTRPKKKGLRQPQKSLGKQQRRQGVGSRVEIAAGRFASEYVSDAQCGGLREEDHEPVILAYLDATYVDNEATTLEAFTAGE